MKKFKKAITLVIIAVPLLTACGNKDIFGTTYTFKHAREDKTDSVRVTFRDGRTYFSSTVNVVLYND